MPDDQVSNCTSLVLEMTALPTAAQILRQSGLNAVIGNFLNEYLLIANENKKESENGKT